MNVAKLQTELLLATCSNYIITFKVDFKIDFTRDFSRDFTTTRASFSLPWAGPQHPAGKKFTTGPGPGPVGERKKT